MSSIGNVTIAEQPSRQLSTKEIQMDVAALKQDLDRLDKDGKMIFQLNQAQSVNSQDEVTLSQLAEYSTDYAATLDRLRDKSNYYSISDTSNDSELGKSAITATVMASAQSIANDVNSITLDLFG